MKHPKLFTTIVILAVILAGAGFMAARLFSTPEEAAADTPDGQPGKKIIELVRDEGDGPFSLRVVVEPAPELPNRFPEAAGVFVNRDGDQIVVGTGQIELDIEVEIPGEETITLSHNGPEVEVVVNDNTVIYHDVTDLDFKPSAQENGEKIIQQRVELAASANGVGENTELQVWGERQGDQIMAEVLVYREAR